MDKYGFIITRHVIDETTNSYWNNCIQRIRFFYPNRTIVVIDDDSNQRFVKAEYPYQNVIYINSEYPKRGELLPYIYFLRNRWFEAAVIIHDSVFIHRRINFENMNYEILPIWHFGDFDDVSSTTLELLRSLKSGRDLMKLYNKTQKEKLVRADFNKETPYWWGVFGCQCFIKHSFLQRIQNKYQLTNLIDSIHKRTERCALERVLGLIITLEYPKIKRFHSIFGDIMTKKWGYSYNEYKKDVENKKLDNAWVKVWTGR